VEPRYLSAWSTRTPCAAATTNSRRRTPRTGTKTVTGEKSSRFLDGVSESARVLDAGCGQGTPVLRDLDSAATAVGTDISRSQLELAAENVPDVALAQGDMVGLPFRNGSFDAVTAYHSLIHVPREQHQEAVDEFARVLADGGRLLCSEGPDEWSGRTRTGSTRASRCSGTSRASRRPETISETPDLPSNENGGPTTRSPRATTRTGRSSRRG